MSRRGTRGSNSRFRVTNEEVVTYLVLTPAASARLLVQHDGLDPARDDFLVDHALLDVTLRRNRVHEVEHQLFQDDAEAAGPHVSLQSLAGDGPQRLVGELEL